MSLNRFGKTLGYQPIKKDAQGNPLCRWCGKVVIRPKRSWCSAECVEEYSIRTNVNHVRKRLLERDHAICAICGKNCGGGLWDADHIVPVIKGGGECGLENYRTLCKLCHKDETRKLRKELALKRKQEKQEDTK